MQPPFSKTSIASAIAMLDTREHIYPRLVEVQPPHQKINKSGPFKLTKVTEEYPYFAHLLNDIIQSKIGELPDFSDDKKIAVMTDFGGEHPGARFHTYSFLFVAYSKVSVFEEQMQALRKKYGLLAPYSEFAYKKLKSWPKRDALPEYLQLIDQFIHGTLITIAVDHQIDTVFGADKKQAQAVIVEQLESLGLGLWAGPAAEKTLRVTHIIAAFASLLTHENQRLLWYSDLDLINEDGKTRNFKDTQEIFNHTLGMYLPHKLDMIGTGKSFAEKSHLDDLLSIPDLAAGVTHDLLKQYETGSDISGGDEKAHVIRWIATPAKYLSKITIQIKRAADGSIVFGTVDMTLNEPPK
jgi:hypothetical protein